MHASLLVPALPVPHQLHPLAAQELQLPLPATSGAGTSSGAGSAGGALD